MTDEWMGLFGHWAPAVVTETLEECRAVSGRTREARFEPHETLAPT